MKLPKYPLQLVLDQRQKAQDEAQQLVATRLAELAVAERRRDAERVELERRVAAHADAEAKLYEPNADGQLGIHTIAERRAGITFRQREIEAQRQTLLGAEQEVSAAVAAVEAAREALTEAAKQLQAITKHHSSWRAEVLAALAKKEEALIGEVANAAWVRKAGERAVTSPDEEAP